MNVVVIDGNVVADPKSFSDGKVVKFALANDVKYGEKTTTSYVQVTVFGKLANVVLTHCKKGTKLGVKGRIQQDTWEDKDGNKREKVGIIMEGFDFQGGKPDSNTAGNKSSQSQGSAASDEIPF